MHTRLALLTLTALAAGGGGTAAAHTGAGDAVRRAAPARPAPRLALPPALPPARDFVRTIDNPWFPLQPGTVLVWKGEDEGTPATDVLRVTHRTKRILGIRATVIHDRVLERGRVAERTTDWYAQDKAGNVWYLGERTATLKPNGRIDSTEGTWRVGVRGARAGMFMPAHPRVGDSGWQEYYKGHAQDRYKVLRRHVRVSTPAGVSHDGMLVRETTPLEPGVVDHKVYVRGFGVVTEDTVKGGNERYQLFSRVPPVVRLPGGERSRPRPALDARPAARSIAGAARHDRVEAPWRRGRFRRVTTPSRRT